jgi:glutamate-1-semialdehyde aminotransferase
VAGLAYGESSVFHVYLEPRGATTPVARREDYTRLGAAVLKGMAPELLRELQNGFRVRGVELLSYNGGMTSAAHEEADVDATVDAFDDLIGGLAARHLLRHL